MKIKVINKSNNPLPNYETKGAAGMDIRANIESSITVKPFERLLIPTGLFIELPFGFEAQIRPRSGLAFKKGFSVLNSPGTIDSDYRGEIKIILINLSNEDQIIEPAERIAQMVIAKHEMADWENTIELESSERGAGGFGHTGVK
jgi:dUTP pyrophosphatase